MFNYKLECYAIIKIYVYGEKKNHSQPKPEGTHSARRPEQHSELAFWVRWATLGRKKKSKQRANRDFFSGPVVLPIQGACVQSLVG